MADELAKGKAAKLYAGKKILGRIEMGESDFPWFKGKFYPSVDFSDIKYLFDAINNEETASDPKLYKKIEKLSLVITPDSGDQKPIRNLFIKIRNGDIAFRYVTDQSYKK